MDNCVVVTKKILDILKVKHTKKYIEDSILSHPDYPSLSSISDTLNKYYVENLAIKIDAVKLERMPTPCLVQVSHHGSELLYILKDISEEEVSYYDDKDKLVHSTRENFLNIWTGICLLAEKSEKSKETDIEKKLASRRTLNLLKASMALLLITWSIIQFNNVKIIRDFTTTLYILGYAFLKIVGLGVGVLLLWFEVDKYNPTLQSFCSGGKKMNCNSVLDSKYAQWFNGALSLSLAGFAYFFGSLAYLIINGFSLSSMALLSFSSFATLPIVIASIYYQATVIKQWCKFCIVLQIVLVAEILIGFASGFYKIGVAPETFPLFIAMLILPVLVWKLIKPLLEQEKEVNLHKRGLKKIKNNPNVLQGLLAKTKKIASSTQGLGISINKETAKYTIIKVCNPYCGPCAKAHSVLEELVTQGKINLQILFTASVDVNDRTAKPVRHFLALDTQGNKIQKALDDWYTAEKKDYEIFADKYPMNGELEQQKHKIKAMRQWCDTEEITHTPTIFINGHKLPKEYSVEDLKEVLT